MYFCQQCGRSTESVQAPTARHTCPYCGAAVQTVESESTPGGKWANVARVTNLAEAGFLADDLTSGKIDARIYQAEDFSAARGAWSTSYLIQVPSDHAQEAAARIRRHLLEEEIHSDSRSDRFTLDSYEAPFDASAWRPLALVVLAGVASFVIGQRFAAPEGPRRPPPRDSLSAAVETIGRPFMTEPVPGKPRYRLSYDWRREAWYLDADFNGNGHFEHRRQFPASGASR